MTKPKTMTVIPADDSLPITTATGAPGLADYQKAVGGYIETVPDIDAYEGRPAVLFCNEEGRINGLPLNARATKVWKDALNFDKRPAGDFWYEPELYGNVIVVEGEDDDEEEVGDDPDIVAFVLPGKDAPAGALGTTLGDLDATLRGLFGE